ncbi:cold shock domain-containing protein [Parachitinimonas caeni]|uniref:NYN domain-containing protein n=1 Tax=Parachitinimonas caeni TaxID=3031301 RepID=A0ABT7DXP6_9NEIS|nr:cold shock domain-containing protein [Parachitinimonas caeni]MDK2123417.1 NYN domain-containing protein [Parachitinimonas caeni]
MTRIGVFYDGNFFSHVSNFYNYHHPRRARISIDGLHAFVRKKVADCENTDVRYCQIVDAHYFRGRLRAQEALHRDYLMKERVFDDVLMRAGVTTHYLPLGPEGEKGIDVWLALEAYETALHKEFDVIALIVCDGDFLPLLRKLNTLGTRVMLLGWDFKYTDQSGDEKETRTAQTLLDEATYPIMMHQVIDDRALKSDSDLNGIFVSQRTPLLRDADETASQPEIGNSTHQRGTVYKLKEGFGFIQPDSGEREVFFYWRDVNNRDFNELKVGDKVQYYLGENHRGVCAKEVTCLGAEMPDQEEVEFVE